MEQEEQWPEWRVGAGGVMTRVAGSRACGTLSGILSHYLVSHPINESPKWNSSLLDILFIGKSIMFFIILEKVS